MAISTVRAEQPLAEQRTHHERVREAIFKAAGASGDPRSFPRLLFDLAEAFKTHARIEERVHPSLQSVMGHRHLEDLGTKVTALQSAVAAALRGAAEHH